MASTDVQILSSGFCVFKLQIPHQGHDADLCQRNYARDVFFRGKKGVRGAVAVEKEVSEM